jgi:hypothetical protein
MLVDYQCCKADLSIIIIKIYLLSSSNDTLEHKSVHHCWSLSLNYDGIYSSTIVNISILERP